MKSVFLFFAVALVNLVGTVNAQTQTGLRVNFVITADALTKLSSRLAPSGTAATTYANMQIEALNEALSATGINAFATRVGWEASSKNAPATSDPTKSAEVMMTDSFLISKRDANAADVTVVIIPCQDLASTTCESGVAAICAASPKRAVVVITEFQFVVDPVVVAHEIGHLACARHPNDPSSLNSKGAYVRERLPGSRTAVCLDDVMATVLPQGVANEVPQRSCNGWYQGPSNPINFTCSAAVFCKEYADYQRQTYVDVGWSDITMHLPLPSSVNDFCGMDGRGSSGGNIVTFWGIYMPPTRSGTEAATACTPTKTLRYSKNGSSYITGGYAWAMGSPSRDAATAISAWLANATNFHNTPLTVWGKATKAVQNILRIIELN